MTEEPVRELGDYLATLRRRWLIVALAAALAVAGAGVFVLKQAPVYRAQLKIVVGQGEGIFLPESGNVAEQFTQTMSDLLQSQIVAQRATSGLGLTLAPGKLLERMHVVTKPESAVLQVEYDDTDRVRGQKILDGVGTAFTDIVNERLVQQGSAKTPVATVSVTVFDAAASLPRPIAPRPARTLSLALLLGLFLGVAAAFLAEQLDDRVRDAAAVAAAFGQAPAALLPAGLVAPRRKHNLGAGTAARIFQRLRAGILWSPASRRSRTVLVVSGHPNEGASTVASTLSLTLAREGHEVILMSASPKRATLGTRPGDDVARPKHGLDAVIAGRVSAREALVDVPVPPATESGGAAHGRLRALFTAPMRGPSSEFSVESVSQTLREVAGLARYVIVEGTPLFKATDAYPFVAACDTVVAVVRAGSTTRADTRTLRETLDRLRTGGLEVVLTEVEQLPLSEEGEETAPPESVPQPSVATPRAEAE